MGGNHSGPQTRNKNSHEREARNFKERTDAHRHADFEEFLQTLILRTHEAVRVHRQEVSAFSPDDPISKKRNISEHKERHARAAPAHRREAEQSVHEDSVERHLEDEHAKRYPHRNFGPRDRSVHGNEDACSH